MPVVINGSTGITTPGLTNSGAETIATTLAVTGATTLSSTVTFGTSALATPSGTAPLYMCRAWVNFNGTGVVAIRGSGNVSSITDNSLANYSVNMSTAMPDANYSICGTVGRGAGFTSPRIIGVGNTNPTASVAQVTVCDDAGNLQDCEYTMVAIIR